MAWNEVFDSQKLSVKLNDGSTASGGVKTVTVNLGTLSTDGSTWDVTKAGAIVEAYGRIASKVIYRINRDVTNRLESDD